MEMRILGKSGIRVSILGFGCGAVGGLMVRGAPADQERAVARALDAGVNYFDTAAQYGDGESEKNLGRILNTLKPRDVVVGTKVRVPADAKSIAAAIAESLEESLRRLGREQVDILHLHNPIRVSGAGALTPAQVLGEVVPAFENLRRQGKLRFLGVTATGETPALHEVIASRAFDSAQVTYNMLNPSAAIGLPPGYPAQDHGKLFELTQATGTGVVGIRVLAGGALSGSSERHPIASAPPKPIGSAKSYEDDLRNAQVFMPLVREGHTASLAEAAIRYCIAHPAMGTILVGMATPQQFEDSLAAVLKGPLPDAALARLAELQQTF